MSTVGELYERSIRLERAGASADEQIEVCGSLLPMLYRSVDASEYNDNHRHWSRH
jgi:hypothetical protein